jgi:[ribosomal protein S5]-alanine N-acetyltransferase
MPPFPALETPRLTLRELVEEDAPSLLAIHGDTEAMRYFGTDPLKELAEAEKVIEKFASWRTAQTTGVRWGIVEKESGNLVGSCGLFGHNREWRRCLTGYELARNSRSKGYMQEALCTAYTWGFSEMQLNRIEALIHPENKESLSLAKRLGFKEEGLLREVAYWGGGFQDLLQLSLLKREWHGGET